MNSVLGSRAAMGYVLGRSAGAAAAQWWLSGGVSAANAIAVYQPIGAASLAASYTNLANPGTYDAAPGVAPTFDAATGWTFNGSSQYLTTGIVPSSGWSALIRFSDYDGTANRYIFGRYDTAATSAILAIVPKSSGGQILYFNGSTLGISTSAFSAAVLGVAGQTAYRNGMAEAGSIPAWSGASAQQLYIGARNVNNAPNAYIAADVQAFAVYDMTLTAPQVAAISAAMAAL